MAGLAAGVALITAARLPAQVIAYDPFNQTAPFQLNGTASSGVPWPTSGGNAPTWGPAFGNGGGVVPGSLSYGPLQTAGNSARFQWFAGDNGSVRSLVSSHGGAGSDFWMSFLMNGSAGNQGMVLYQGTTQPQLWIGTPGSTTNFGMRLFGTTTAEGTTQDRYVTPTVTPDTATHFVAIHFSFGSAGFTNAVTLYVDPDPSSLGTGAAPTGGSSVSYTTANAFPFENLVLYNQSGVSGTAGAVTFDEIRLGSTWASVSPVSPVPEPSALLLTGGALAVVTGLLRRRR
jgi:hypothetical protein